jgi:hypothetical protein
MNRFTLLAAIVATLTACGSDAESREDTEGEPTSRSAPAPAARTAPAPTTGPATSAEATPAATVRAIPSGTLLTFRVVERVSTSSHVAGDAFSLVLVDAVNGQNGAMLAAGATARGSVTESRASAGPEDQALLAVRVASVQAGGTQVPVLGEVQSVAIESSTRDSGTRTAATIATGAAAGAVIGQILGRDTRSTVAGAAVGTAVGVGVALTTRDGDAALTEGSLIVLRLDRDLIY